MENIEQDRLFCRKTEVIGADVADGHVLLDLDSSKYIQFNATAKFVWNLLESPITPGRIVELVQESFEVESEQCQVEVDALLKRLLALGIVSYQ